jgi:hypothetical protein
MEKRMEKDMRCKQILLVLFASALISVPAAAEITIPWTHPGWYGTHQMWSFDTEPGDFTAIAPEVDDNPNGAPVASVISTSTSTLWPDWFPAGPANPGDPGHSGVIYVTPEMRLDLLIPNAPADLTKFVQVEILYHAQTAVGSGYEYSWLDPDNGPPVGPVEVVEDFVQQTGEGWWRDLTLEFQFPQSQALTAELISVWLHDSGVYLDSVEVATICVPVPAALLLGLLGLGGAGLKLRKFV